MMVPLAQAVHVSFRKPRNFGRVLGYWSIDLQYTHPFLSFIALRPLSSMESWVFGFFHCSLSLCANAPPSPVWVGWPQCLLL